MVAVSYLGTLSLWLRKSKLKSFLTHSHNSNSHALGLHYLTFVRRNKQKNQSNGASCFKKKCHRKAQHYQSSLKEEKPLQFEFTNIAAKKPQPLL
jgi:hypothetical protein